MTEWQLVTWQGGPHDGLVQKFAGGRLREWRVCECHGVAYRYVGVVNETHLLVVNTGAMGASARQRVADAVGHDPR